MDQKIINILGYNGSALAIYFDMLLASGFQGRINIIKNDDREALEEFDMGIPYKILMIDECSEITEGRFLICSNKPSTKYFLINVFGEVFSDLENRLLTLIHPASYIGGKVEISTGVVIEPGVCVSPFARLGKGVFIGRGATIGHHNEIGDWSTINPGATLTGKVRLGEYVTIGPGTTITNKISIGSKSIIGAGSVVTRDIPSGVVAFGNPCKVIRENTLWPI
jgi:sugar O-acyltransferase (sialic acid O-acetyltransferase NeuD family)